MKILTFIKGELATNTYICIDSSDPERAIVIDPGMRGDLIYEKISERSLNVGLILLTHGHFDHSMGCAELKKLTGAKLAVHSADAEMLSDPQKNAAEIFFGGMDSYPVAEPDILFEDGDTFPLGNEKLQVIHTPGHTMGSSVFRCGDILFTGDTLFSDGAGRTDLYGGNADMLESSIKRLYSLGGSFRILPGHGSSRTVVFS